MSKTTLIMVAAAAAAAVAGTIQGGQTDQKTALGEEEGDPLVAETH